MRGERARTLPRAARGAPGVAASDTNAARKMAMVETRDPHAPGGPAEAERRGRGYLVDPASSDMLVSKIKPCRCKYEFS